MLQYIYLGTLGVSVVYLFMISILFHLKLKQNTIENSIYKGLIISNLFSILFELFLCSFATYYGQNILLNNIFLIVGKIFVCCIFIWTFILLIYTIFLGRVNYKNKYKFVNKSFKNYRKKRWYKFIILFFVINILLILLLPMEYYTNGREAYTQGASVDVGFFIIFMLIFTIIISLIKSRKVLIVKKAIPIFLFVGLFLVSTIVQFNFPGLLLFNPVLTFITVLMYHTIENPDIKLIRALEIANKEAIKANNAKSDFLSSMSHEIRTPLNAIIGFSECIKSDTTLEEAKSDADDIIMASNNLLELINGILNISKIEANKMKIVEVNYKPLDVFNDLEKMIRARLGKKTIQFKTDFSPEIPSMLNGDVGKFKEIIMNLLTNAVKYTDKGTIIFTVKCSNKNNVSRLFISVLDTGKGIKKENLSKLFMKFERLDEVKNSNIEGTGLGLSITKALVDLMKGKIEVFSEYGKGSEFRVYLQQKIVMQKDVKEINKEEEIENLYLSGKKILIVDDSEMNLKVASRIFKTYNLTIDFASSGQECLNKINMNYKYDLIFMDDMMPNMTGTETLAKLKKINGFNTPVVVLTANAIEGQREKYIESGFDDYLSKPMKKNCIVEILKKFLMKI